MPDEITEVATIEPQQVSLIRSPNKVLEEGKEVSTMLKTFLDKKPKKVVINGKRFLEFDDWALIASAYGVMAKVVESEFVDYAGVKGFESTAVAFHVQSGKEVSRGSALCMNDEPDWKSRPLQKIKSMSQTRACSKALKQCFSWIAVLGGFATTPAEEVLPEKNDSAEPAPTTDIVPIKAIAAEIHDTIGVLCQGDPARMAAMVKEFTSWKDKATGEEKSLDFDAINRLTMNPSKHAWIRKIHARIAEFASNNKAQQNT